MSMMKVYTLPFTSEEQGSVVVARTSRSPNRFDEIFDEVKEKGHKPFLEKNVLGYGHDSVAEGAICPWILFEDISDLAANIIATADPQLIVQMTSTRYQNMGARRVLHQQGPGESATGEAMKADYLDGMAVVGDILGRTNHPRKQTLNCDIARSKLPAGISTQFGVRGNARTIRDTINFLIGHPLGEVAGAGERMLVTSKDFVEVLLERHIVPAIAAPHDPLVQEAPEPGAAAFLRFEDIETKNVLAELKAWRDSKWRRRMRMAAGAWAPTWHAFICSDWGAYRDLRRNRTIQQDDLLPSPMALPADALWAFRKLYPEVCADIDTSTWSAQHTLPSDPLVRVDPYLAPMGSLVSWRAGGHPFNWAYLLRLRSAVVCHPGYAIPCRNLMRQIVAYAPTVADAMGIVESPKSLLGVEFSDRVPE